MHQPWSSVINTDSSGSSSQQLIAKAAAALLLNPHAALLALQAIDMFAEAVFEGMSSMMESFLDGADLEELVNEPSPRLPAGQASRA